VAKAKRQRSDRAPQSRRKRRTHSADGVDLTLIRWMLSLTPGERLKVLRNNMRAMMRLRNGTVAT